MKHWNSCSVWGVQSLYCLDAQRTGYTVGKKNTNVAAPAFWRRLIRIMPQSLLGLQFSKNYAIRSRSKSHKQASVTQARQDGGHISMRPASCATQTSAFQNFCWRQQEFGCARKQDQTLIFKQWEAPRIWAEKSSLSHAKNIAKAFTWVTWCKISLLIGAGAAELSVLVSINPSCCQWVAFHLWPLSLLLLPRKET